MKVRLHSMAATLTLLVNLVNVPAYGGPRDDRQLLAVREDVWRSWFADDEQPLRRLVPLDTIVISAGEQLWKNQADVLRQAAEFHASGGKLVRLDFPRTRIQHFGKVAILWSDYVVETETQGKRSLTTGRVTEVFVWRAGRWVNPGWHTDAEK